MVTIKTSIWILCAAIPERGEPPGFPNVFTSEDEAESFAEGRLQEEWEGYAPTDDDGELLPYPGDWRKANDALVEINGDGSWGQWEMTSHEINIEVEPHPAIVAMQNMTTPAEEYAASPGLRFEHESVEDYISELGDDRLCGDAAALWDLIAMAKGTEAKG